MRKLNSQQVVRVLYPAQPLSISPLLDRGRGPGCGPDRVMFSSIIIVRSAGWRRATRQHGMRHAAAAMEVWCVTYRAHGSEIPRQVCLASTCGGEVRC